MCLFHSGARTRDRKRSTTQERSGHEDDLGDWANLLSKRFGESPIAAGELAAISAHDYDIVRWLQLKRLEPGDEGHPDEGVAVPVSAGPERRGAIEVSAAIFRVQHLRMTDDLDANMAQARLELRPRGSATRNMRPPPTMSRPEHMSLPTVEASAARAEVIRMRCLKSLRGYWHVPQGGIVWHTGQHRDAAPHPIT